MNRQYFAAVIILAGVFIQGISARADGLPASATEGQAGSPWYVGLGGGYLGQEGDEATKGGGFVQLKLGYDFTRWWSFEGSLLVFPQLDKNYVTDNYPEPHPRPGIDADSTWATGLAADALLHLNPAADRHWDPYLLAGVGATYYGHEREDAWRVDPLLRYGVGLAYHFNQEWSVHADFDYETPIHRERDAFEFNMMPSAGINWKWGAPRARSVIAAGGNAAGAEGAAAPFTPTPPPKDDLRMFKLDIMFTEGHWHPEYISELDAIAKVIQGYPDSEILIEGHLDQQPNMTEQDAQKWTKQRADSVRDYLVDNHRIARKRIVTVGCGFSRPLAPNDPARGNPENRRLEIHIRPPPPAAH